MAQNVLARTFELRCRNFPNFHLCSLFWATLKAGMTERRNHGMAESRNGGKLPQIQKDGIAESRNGGKYPQILKDGMMENHPKS